MEEKPTGMLFGKGVSAKDLAYGINTALSVFELRYRPFAGEQEFKDGEVYTVTFTVAGVEMFRRQVFAQMTHGGTFIFHWTGRF